MSDKGLVFISYQQIYRAFAEALRTQLQTWGWQTWMDVFDIPSEAHEPKEIEKGLQAADKVIAVMTPAAVRSERILNEWEYAVVHGKQLIAIELEPCNLPPNLTRLTLVDFVKQSTPNWSALETALENHTSSANNTPDPYLPYLQNLYKRLNTNLAQKVINRKDSKALLPNPLHLRSSSTPEDVDVLFAKQDDINPVFEADTLTTESEKLDYDDFESAFDYYDGQVLLLGEPGSGKTITLLQFARDAVVRRIQDPTQRLPMFAILPDWLKLGTPEIRDWMAETADAPADAANLVREGRALLLFDGLDELGDVAQEINPIRVDQIVEFDPRVRFMLKLKKVVRNPDMTEMQGADNELVVTCRLQDYRRTGAKIGLKGAVILKKLDQAQIDQYLEGVPGLQAIFKNDVGMQKIAETPLLLSLIAYAFREKTGELQGLRSLRDGALRDAIFNAFLSQRYEHERDKLKAQKHELPYELAALIHDLGWTAMVNAAQQNFASENVLIEADFWRVVGSSKSRALIAFCQQLNLIAQIDATTWRFIHLKLRDTLAYGQAAQILKTKGISHNLFVLAGKAIVNIKDKRLISEILTNKTDRGKLLTSLPQFPAQFRTLEELFDSARTSYGSTHWVHSRRPMVEIDPLQLQMLIADLNSPNADRRAKAAEDLGTMRDRRTVEALLRALNDPNYQVRYRAVMSLGNLRAVQAVESLLSLFRRENLGIRREIIDALGDIGVRNAKVMELLIKVLRDPDFALRGKAAQALGTVGDLRAIPSLIRAMSDEDAVVRENAAKALSNIDDPRAIEALIVALKDKSRGVRYAAAAALEEVGDPRATRGLLKALADEAYTVRDKAALGLENIGDAKVVRGLIRMLSHEQSYVRAKVAETLGRIGSKKAIGPLVEALKDAEYQVRAKAAEGLGRIGDSQVVETLLDFMHDPNKYVRASTAEALGRISDKRSMKPLLKALDDPTEPVRAKAAQAVGNMDDKHISIVFKKALHYPDLEVHKVAVRVLASIPKPWAITCLVLALSNADENLRYQAANALGIPGNVQAAEGLANLLSDSDVNVRRISATALGRIGSASAVQKLVAALYDSNQDVCRAVAEALGRIGDADSLPELEKALGDSRIASMVAGWLTEIPNEYAFRLAEEWKQQNKKE